MREQSGIEGSVSVRPNRVLIDSDLEPLQLYIPSKLKVEVKKRAEKENLTIDELMLKIIQKEFAR